MNRREFLKTAGGVAGAGAAASATAAAQEDDGSSTTTSGGNTTTTNGTATGTTAGGGGGTTETVAVGPGGQNVFEPAELYVKPGTTVEFVWEGPGHNVHATSSPEDSWTYQGPIVSPPNTYTHTFETLGEYEYQCDPHASLGMKGTIIVNEAGAAPSGGGGGEVDPEHMGVPFQAHFVGIATILAIISSLVFTFYTLKYGESPHSSSPNRK